MRLRGIEVAGIVAAVGLVVLFLLAFLPSRSEPVVTTGDGADSVLSPATPSASPTESAQAPDDEAPSEAEPTSEAAPTAIGPRRRAAIAIQVVNGGANPGAAALTTLSLSNASFNPRDPSDAPAAVEDTVVLHAEGRRLAARTAADVIGAEPSDVVRASSDDPNWSAFGADLDVLVVLGPALP